MADESSKNLKYYIPKKDTQQEEFLTKYPEYDGRGILIAIIDDGNAVVSLPGMQKTSTGLPKIYDFFDFTGNANIDTSTVRKCNEKNILIGLSGRELKIPSKWINPTGKWHLGSKSFYDLCYGNDQKNKINKNYALSENTVLDCIVWFDGEKWQSCCDTSFKGDLEDIKILTNYSDEHEFSYLMEDISYCIKIGDNGNLLQIFVPNRDHGTIVSQVAAANFPEEPEKNGLAPGAQIVSMNAGLSDHVFPMNNALLKCIEMHVDIINLSITVHEIHEALIKKMIEEDGIIFVINGGNDGPSYSSMMNTYEHVHNDKMFFIGAVLTSEMKTLFYNVNENNIDSPPTVCLYSSRGPRNDDGSRGMTFSAPGGVIISLPKWKPIEHRRCLGTSVSTPIAAGSIACLLSALKANSIKYSPENIKLALSNTAYLPEGGDRLGFGNGIIQIDSAFEYYKNVLINSSMKRLINLSIGWLNKKYGIFLTESSGTIKEYSVNLDISNEENHSSWKLKLIPENSETWIQHSHTVTNNSFNVKIDTNQLKLGSLNYAEIHGYNSTNSSIGSLFYFPVTVIVPEELTLNENFSIQKELILESRIPYRHFFIPPSSYFQECSIKATSLEEMSTELCVSYGGSCKSKILSFTSKNQVQRCVFKIDWKKLCEISICHSNLSNAETSQSSYRFNIEVNFDVKFKGESKINDQRNISSECNGNQKTASTSFYLI